MNGPIKLLPGIQLLGLQIPSFLLLFRSKVTDANNKAYNFLF